MLSKYNNWYEGNKINGISISFSFSYSNTAVYRYSNLLDWASTTAFNKGSNE